MTETDSEFMAWLSRVALDALKNRAHVAEAEIDRLRAEVERLRAGGCARDQSTTQYCAEAARLAAENEKMREALAWYGEQARLCRIIHSEGDAGRNALAEDGGERARAALAGSPPAEREKPNE